MRTTPLTALALLLLASSAHAEPVQDPAADSFGRIEAPWVIDPLLYDRVVARLSGGDPQGALAMLDHLGDRLEPAAVARIRPVVAAATGDPDAALSLLDQARTVPEVGGWLRLHAARGLGQTRPLLGLVIAERLADRDTVIGRHAGKLAAELVRELGDHQAAGELLGKVLGRPDVRLRGISNALARSIPAQIDGPAEVERAWILLDSWAYSSAVSAFEHALLRTLDPALRCWALWGSTRANARAGDYHTAVDSAATAIVGCAQHEAAGESLVWLARAAFARADAVTFKAVFDAVRPLGSRYLQRSGLSALEALQSANRSGIRGPAAALARDVRGRLQQRVSADPVVPAAMERWRRLFGKRRYAQAAAVLEPVVKSGVEPSKASYAGQPAYWLARTHEMLAQGRRARPGAEARARSLHEANVLANPTSWYGQLSFQTIPESRRAKLRDRLAARPKDHLAPVAWDLAPKAAACAQRLRLLRAWGLVDAIEAEAEYGRLTAQAGRAAWVARLLLDSGAPQRAAALAERVLRRLGARSPIEGPRVLWELAWPTPYRGWVEAEASAAVVDPWLVWAVMRVESRYSAPAISGAGARGLLQVMPGTAAYLRRLYPREEAGPTDLLDPPHNVYLGTRFLGRLAESFLGIQPLVFGAYNAGPGRMRRWIRESKGADLADLVETLPGREAKAYIRSVSHAWATYHLTQGRHGLPLLGAGLGPGLAVPADVGIPPHRRGQPDKKKRRRHKRRRR